MNSEPARDSESAGARAPQPAAAPAPRFSRWLQLYRRYEKYFPVVTFAAGFAWDSLTLTRIDRLSDNFILLGYLLALGGMIIFTLRGQAGLLRNRWILRFEPHFLWAMQFLMGGLLSSY